MTFSDADIRLIRVLQEDFPTVEQPFAAVAERAGMSEEDAMEKITEWKGQGIIRRFGALLAHRRAGITANGMVVWDVPEEQIETLGARYAAHPAVSHCYARPRFDGWVYRLYTMVHATTREGVEAVAEELAAGVDNPHYRILYSTREFKKSDTKLFCED